MPSSSSADRKEGRLAIIAGLITLWLASLGVVLEIINVNLNRSSKGAAYDPSSDALVGVFCFFLALLGVLLLWRGRRTRHNEPVVQLDRYLNIAMGINVLILGILLCVGSVLLSADQYYFTQSQQKRYVRSAPRPDFALTAFPTPAPSPAPAYNAGAKHLAGDLLGSIDHLRVGDVWISLTPDGKTIEYLQFTIQSTECVSPQPGGLTIYAIDRTQPVLMGPVDLSSGRFYLDTGDVRLHGSVFSPEEIMGTVYVRYTDPTSGQTCEIGALEWDAFLTE